MSTNVEHLARELGRLPAGWQRLSTADLNKLLAYFDSLGAQDAVDDIYTELDAREREEPPADTPSLGDPWWAAR